MKNRSKVYFLNYLKDLFEVYIPSIAFIILFISFIIGIVWRYIFNNPQSWTFEISSICYLTVGVLSWGISHRTDDHIVFDMLYAKVSPAVQCVFRIVGNLLISITAILLISPSISYMESMKNLSTQIIHIPRFLIFLPFTISFVATAMRSGYRLALDVNSFYKKEYLQVYGKKEGNE